MKTIGLIGGLSWESTAEYYRLLNRFAKEKKGGFSQAKCIVFSVDLAEILELQDKGDWGRIGLILANAAKSLEVAGSDMILLCTNTMHKVAEDIQSAITVPFLHIADETGKCLVDNHIKQVGFLGTVFTMEQEFYIGRLREKFGLEVLLPEETDRQKISNIIYNELCMGTISNESKKYYREVMNKLVERGARGIILGCTEITLLVNQQDSPVTVFDTTFIHAKAAFEAAMG